MRIDTTLAYLSEKVFHTSLRLAVTGLSQGGKTAFITSLLNQLLSGRPLPFFSLANEERFVGAKLVPGHSEKEAFNYEACIAGLVGDHPQWPEPTDQIREIRIAIRYRSQRFFKRRAREFHTFYLDIVDYPGEWLLDLPLLDVTFEQWNRQIALHCSQSPRRELAREWLKLFSNMREKDGLSQNELAALVRAYTAFLVSCRKGDYELSVLQPGRFLMPGELKNDVLLEFCPFPLSEGERVPAKNQLYALLERRFNDYKEKVVKQFYNEEFSRFDRQIVLIDLLRTLNTSYATFKDMEEALGEVLHSFHYGKSGLLRRLFLPNRIDKVLFAVTKADHVATNQHHNLRILLEGMISAAAREISYQGASYSTTTISAIKSTQSVVTDYHGQKLSCIKGIPKGEDKEIILFPGEIPDYYPTEDDWAEGRFNFKNFDPPRLAKTARVNLPHIRIDHALEFLLGDLVR